MLLCLKEHSKKGPQEQMFCTRIGIGFAVVEMAHSHSMAKKLSKEHSKKQNFFTRLGPLVFSISHSKFRETKEQRVDGPIWLFLAAA